MHLSLSMGSVVSRVLGAERVTVHIGLPEREGLGQTWEEQGRGRRGEAEPASPREGREAGLPLQVVGQAWLPLT